MPKPKFNEREYAQAAIKKFGSPLDAFNQVVVARGEREGKADPMFHGLDPSELARLDRTLQTASSTAGLPGPLGIIGGAGDAVFNNIYDLGKELGITGAIGNVTKHIPGLEAISELGIPDETTSPPNFWENAKANWQGIPIGLGFPTGGYVPPPAPLYDPTYPVSGFDPQLDFPLEQLQQLAGEVYPMQETPQPLEDPYAERFQGYRDRLAPAWEWVKDKYGRAQAGEYGLKPQGLTYFAETGLDILDKADPTYNIPYIAAHYGGASPEEATVTGMMASMIVPDPLDIYRAAKPRNFREALEMSNVAELLDKETRAIVEAGGEVFDPAVARREAPELFEGGIEEEVNTLLNRLSEPSPRVESQVPDVSRQVVQDPDMDLVMTAEQQRLANRTLTRDIRRSNWDEDVRNYIKEKVAESQAQRGVPKSDDIEELVGGAPAVIRDPAVHELIQESAKSASPTGNEHLLELAIRSERATQNVLDDFLQLFPADSPEGRFIHDTLQNQVFIVRPHMDVDNGIIKGTAKEPYKSTGSYYQLGEEGTAGSIQLDPQFATDEELYETVAHEVGHHLIKQGLRKNRTLNQIYGKTAREARSRAASAKRLSIGLTNVLDQIGKVEPDELNNMINNELFKWSEATGQGKVFDHYLEDKAKLKEVIKGTHPERWAPQPVWDDKLKKYVDTYPEPIEFETNVWNNKTLTHDKIKTTITNADEARVHMQDTVTRILGEVNRDYRKWVVEDIFGAPGKKGREQSLWQQLEDEIAIKKERLYDYQIDPGGKIGVKVPAHEISARRLKLWEDRFMQGMERWTKRGDQNSPEFNEWIRDMSENLELARRHKASDERRFLEKVKELDELEGAKGMIGRLYEGYDEGKFSYRTGPELEQSVEYASRVHGFPDPRAKNPYYTIKPHSAEEPIADAFQYLLRQEKVKRPGNWREIPGQNEPGLQDIYKKIRRQK